MCLVFFFNDTATTEIYTLSLHDALPIFVAVGVVDVRAEDALQVVLGDHVEVPSVVMGDSGVRESASGPGSVAEDRKSTRLNSSHANISYAVFCLKKKNNNIRDSPLSQRP